MKYLIYDFEKKIYSTVHHCANVLTINDMGANIPWCPKVHDFPEYREKGAFISHCVDCSFYESEQQSFVFND